MVVGVSGMVGDDLLPLLEDAARRPADQRRTRPPPADLDRVTRARMCGRPQGRRPGPHLPRRPELPDRPSRPLCAAAARDRARVGDVVSPLPRGARAARPRLLRLRHEPLVHRRRVALRAGRRRHQAHRRSGQGDRRAVPPASPHEPRAGRRAREGTLARQGPLRPAAPRARRADLVRPPPRGARG